MSPIATPVRVPLECQSESAVGLAVVDVVS